jgi:hypothetical protein
MNTPTIQPHLSTEPRSPYRENVKPLTVFPPDEQVTISADRHGRNWCQLSLEELEAYCALQAAGRATDLRQLEQFRPVSHLPRNALDSLVETGLVCRRYLVLAHGWQVMWYEPSPVSAEREKPVGNAKDEANRRTVSDAIRKAGSISSASELTPFCDPPLTEHFIRKTLKQLVELGAVVDRPVRITPRKSMSCYSLANDLSPITKTTT